MHVALDDFGTGHSSLAYLRELPVDILKIDRSFVATITEHGQLPPIVRGMLELGHVLQLEVIAEGVELPLPAAIGCATRTVTSRRAICFVPPLDQAAAEALLHRDAERTTRAVVPSSRAANWSPRKVRDMDQRVSIITLGVTDLGRARSFYEALGWHGQEVEETVFFQAGGQAVVLWARAKVAADAGLDDDGTSTFGGIVLAHNVASRDEVDRIVGAAAAAGATVTKAPPRDVLRRVRRLLPRPGRSRVGGRAQPGLHAERRRHPHAARLRGRDLAKGRLFRPGRRVVRRARPGSRRGRRGTRS